MAYGIIYKILDTTNWKVYIGQSVNFMERWRFHQSFDSKNKTPELYIDQMIQQIGKQNFTIKIIDQAETAYQLTKLEDYWISFFNSLNPEFGYNKRSSTYFPPETRLKISRALTGRKQSPEHVAKVIQANLGRKQHPESIAKLKQTKLQNRLANPDKIYPGTFIFQPEQIEQIIKLRNNKMSLKKIGDQFNVSRNIIKKVLIKRNIYCSLLTRRPSMDKIILTAAQVFEINQLRQSGLSLQKIGAKFNISVSTVERTLFDINGPDYQIQRVDKILFTQEQINNIVLWRQNDKTLKYIADKFSVDRCVIVRILKEQKQYIKTLGIWNKKIFTVKQEQQIVELRKSGMILSSIADLFNVSINCINRILDQYNMPHNGNKTIFTTTQEQKIIDLRKSGASLKQIANIFNTTRDVVIRIMREKNMPTKVLPVFV